MAIDPIAEFKARQRQFQESRTGPFIRTVQALQHDPSRLESWRQEVDEMLGEYLHDNVVRQEYLLTRAIKARVFSSRPSVPCAESR